jgi:DNA-binding response OmpR family regulator
MANILLIEYARDLLEVHRTYLRKEGHAVSAAATVDGALRAVQWGEFQVLVLGHKVPPRQRDILATTAKRLRPSARILVLYSNKIEGPVLADASLDIGATLEELRHMVESLTAVSND